jgi:hypothetical protein
MRNTGIGVAVFGALLVTGAVIMAGLSVASQNACNASGDDDCEDFSGIGPFFALLLGGLGVAHLAVGVPLVIAGSQPAKVPAVPAIVPGNATVAGSRSVALQWSF